MSKAFNKLNWHDGQLASVSFSIDAKGKSTATVFASFYTDSETRARSECLILCEGVTRFSTSVDAEELKNNLFAGTISNGYVKANTLWVYVTDGVIEIHAKKFRLSAR